MAFKISENEFLWVNPSKTPFDQFDITVTVGAGMPKNRAALYQIINELYRSKLISAEEAREFIVKELSLPIKAKFEELT